MILLLVAGIYITILCWCWGMMLFRILKLITSEQASIETNFFITCFSGLALIGVVFGALSLFIPLGYFIAHICLVLPACTYWTVYKKDHAVFIKVYFSQLRNVHGIVITLLIVSSFLVLAMSAFTIKHPDTLHYHAQCIQWIQDYKVVPGLANLSYHYGLQSSWFVLCALFSFKFIGFDSLTFLNCTVVLWLIFFVGSKINESINQRNYQSGKMLPGTMWLLLLVMSFASYTQVRLTATSASPDFIAVLYVWLIFFLILFPGKPKLTDSRLLLMVFLSLFVSTIKLSAVPVILPALYYYSLGTKKKRIALTRLFVCAFVVLSPSIIRNIVTTGYPFFPSVLADFLVADWKVPKELMNMRLDYIKAYARLGDVVLTQDVRAAATMNFTDWIPAWWHNQSIADKIILGGFPVLFSGNLFFLKKIAWRPSPAFIFSLVGLFFWFIQAPDPRFGFGFIIVSEGLLMYFLLSHFSKTVELKVVWFKGLLLLFTACLVFYSIYRVTNFFKRQDIIKPEGFVKLPFKTIQCQGVRINIPLGNLGCGNNPVPCAYEDCDGFILRGREITSGFKPAVTGLK